MFPLIPILAALGIIGGISTLVWYSNLSAQQQEEADRKAIAWFGQRFKDLSEGQQARIRDSIKNQP
jgi:hypothetical protein